MKKIIISTVLVIVILIPIGFLSICIYVNKNTKDEGIVNSSIQNYFYETYNENRVQFRRAAVLLEKHFADVEITKLIVPSKVDSDLSIDTVYIPAQKKPEKLLIMTSGVHGIEGFTGSAIQRYFMSEVLDTNLLQNVGILLVHAINPHGFNYVRRVSENNIDMNRNFDVSKSLFEEKNEEYAKINQFLNPRKRANAGFFVNGAFFVKTAYYINRYSMRTLRKAILKGQYEFKEGIFYGGNDFESQKDWLESLISKKVDSYKFVFVIDIHTGYGKRGKLHILPGNVKNKERNSLLKKMFEGYVIDEPRNDNQFYDVKGGFIDYVGSLMPPNKKYIGTYFEFGTLDSQRLAGSIRSLHNMIIEKQGFHHGYKNKRAEKRIKERFREMFFPSSNIWRSQIMNQASEILPVLTNRYIKLKS